MLESSGFIPLPRAVPLEQNIAPLALDGFFDALGQSPARMRGAMVLRGGQVIGERFWEPYQPQDRVWVYSISKSFTTTAVGLAVDAGVLSLEDSVASFFPQQCPAAISENLANMRLRDLLTMTSGHHEDTLPHIIGAPDGDWVRAFLALPVEHVPGSYFRYNSGASFVAAAMVQKASGQKMSEFLQQRLFDPLGFDTVEWDESPAGITAGGWGITLRLEDLAKLGQLYLERGIYNGQRILSRTWVEQATAKQVNNDQNPDDQSPDWVQGYGLHFWRCQHDAFRGDGALGQYCIVLPRQNAVVAIMSEVASMQAVLDVVWDELLPAFDQSSSPVETVISGRRYTLDKNEMNLDTVWLDFAEGNLVVSFQGAAKCHMIQAGRGTWCECEALLPFGSKTLLPVFTIKDSLQKLSATFRWQNSNTLEVNWVYRQTPHTDQMLCHFEGANVELVWPPSPVGAYVGMKESRVRGHMENADTLSDEDMRMLDREEEHPVEMARTVPASTSKARFTRQSKFGDLLKDERAVAVMEQHMPGATKNPAIKLVRKMTMERLAAAFPQIGLNDELLDALLQEINSAI